MNIVQKNIFVLIPASSRPALVAKLPNEVLATLASTRPELVGNLPDEVLILIIDRQDVLPTLSDQDLIALVKLKPSILGLPFDHLPTLQLLMLLSSRPQLLHSLPTSADNIISRILGNRSNQNKLLKLVKAMPARNLATLASSKTALVANLPDEVLILIIAGRQDILPLLSDADLIALVKIKPKSLALLVNHLSTSQLLEFHSSRPQLLPSLPTSADPIISNLLKNKRSENKLLKLIEAMPARVLASLASNRPWLIAHMPLPALKYLVDRDDLLPLLKDDHLHNLLSFKPSLLSVIAQLTAGKLSTILRSRPALIERLPPSAKPILSSLLLQKSFLSKISLPLMAKLASSPTILQLVTKLSLIQVIIILPSKCVFDSQVLLVHPTLPSQLETSTLLPLLHYIQDPWFRARLPCSAVTSLVEKPGLLRSLPPGVLESILTSRRLLACLPSSLLEQVLNLANIIVSLLEN